ncbi:glucosyltransferase domain-containing protein [Lacticaseibacillus paracasei]|nr:glucosyltransferase domain-containing protein [Lacticaseibacillus paracasei]WBS98134.1 glucosyltransferase domain-containing protein [Lacticaseibacillus paracasei]
MGELQDFKIFFKKRLFAINSIVLTTLLLYLPKLTNFSYSIDSERMVNNPVEVLNSWIGIGRFGLVFLKRFFLFGINVNPFFINVTTYLLLCTSAVLLLYILDRITSLSIYFKVLAVLMYVC